MFEYYDAKSQEWIVDIILEEDVEKVLYELFENREKEEKSYGDDYC